MKYDVYSTMSTKGKAVLETDDKSGKIISFVNADGETPELIQYSIDAGETLDQFLGSYRTLVVYPQGTRHD